MEDNSLISFSHLKAVLEEYGKVVEDYYKNHLEEADKRASGALISSVRYIYSKSGIQYVINLGLEDYWKYVEYGRRPGKFPPIDKILEWIQVKQILPRPDADGNLPTEKQLAFLIARHIAEDGIEAGNYLKDTLEEINAEFTLRLEEAITQDLDEGIGIIFTQLL